MKGSGPSDVAKAWRVLVLHGPNLGALGTREPAVYGTTTLADIDAALLAEARELGATVEAHQTNLEGELVTAIEGAHQRFDGILLNPAGYAHTSVAILDALRASKLPTIEVHLSNVHAREPYRHQCLTAGACVGFIAGLGPRSYTLGLRAIIDYLKAAVGI